MQTKLVLGKALPVSNSGKGPTYFWKQPQPDNLSSEFCALQDFTHF